MATNGKTDRGLASHVVTPFLASVYPVFISANKLNFWFNVLLMWMSVHFFTLVCTRIAIAVNRKPIIKTFQMGKKI